MDRRYGGDPLAPPRPPKLLPRVHRPRAPEPSIMSPVIPLRQQQSNTIITTAQQVQQHQQQQQPPQVVRSHQSLLSSSSTPPIPISVHLINALSSPAVTTAVSIPIAPITAPLLPSSSFSRRRPPPPNITVPIPTISSLSSDIVNSLSPISPVTLAAPRPENERLANEYVETPFRTASHHPIHLQHHGTTVDHHVQHLLPGIVPTATTTATEVPASRILSSASFSSSTGSPPKQIVPSSSLASYQSTPATTTTTTTAPFRTGAMRPTALPLTAITKQPKPFPKDAPTPSDAISLHHTVDHHLHQSLAALHDNDIDQHSMSNEESKNSINCQRCKRCRCEECLRPRELPSTWFCDTCLCSAESIIDYVSCLCCIKALFYHCSKDSGDSISCADDPCSCLPQKRIQRWACLGALTSILPCLLSYWPMRGCVALCGSCYDRYTRPGCRCSPSKVNGTGDGGHANNGVTGDGGIDGNIISSQTGGRQLRSCDLTPEKRLLDSSPEY